MKKLFFAAVVAALSFGSASFADTSAASSAGQESMTLGGAGSIGNGAALSGSSVQSKQYSAGVGLAGSTGGCNCGPVLEGSATSTVATGSATAVNGAVSSGQAGGFSGSATAGGSTAKATAKTRTSKRR